MHNLTKIAAVLLMLVGLALGFYAWMLSRTATVAPPPASVSRPATSWPIVVAARHLPAGTSLKAEDLRVERLTAQAEGTYAAPAAVLGRVTAVEIGAGMPVSAQHLSTGLALKVPEGERAVAIKVDEIIGVGNRVRPGDFVDVFLVVRRDGGEVDRSKARLLLSRKMVLAYGAGSIDAMAAGAQGAGAGGPGAVSAGAPAAASGNAATAGAPANPGARADGARTAVLSVPLAEVNALALAGSTGALLLALRNPADGAVPDGKGADSLANRAAAGAVMADVTGPPGKAAPATSAFATAGTTQAPAQAAPRAAPRRAAPAIAVAADDGVEIIRGGRRELVAN